MSVRAEVGETFEEIFPVLVDLRRVLHEMTKSRRPFPHESRVESLVLDRVDSRFGETVDETSDAADVHQDLIASPREQRQGRHWD